MSLVWQYFTKSEQKNIVACKLCTKQVKTSGTTSNLLAHLKTKHVFAFDACTKKKKIQKKHELMINIVQDNNSKENLDPDEPSTSNHSRLQSPLTVDIPSLPCWKCLIGVN